MIKFGQKIPVMIHPIFWLTAGIIGWINTWNLTGTLIWIGIIFISILVHEFGHALTSKLFGQNAEIQLVALGGLTYHDGKQLKKWQDFIIVLMGPLFGLGLAGAAYLLKMGIGSNVSIYVTYILTLFIVVNIFWTIVNLLPILPLDGGQLLRIILEGFFGHRGLKITLLIGIVLALSAGAFAFIYGYFLGGAILLLLAFESFASYRQVKGMSMQDQSEDVQKMLEEAQAELQLGRLESAKEKLSQLRDKAHKGILFTAASEQLGFILEKEGHMQKVYEILEPLKKSLSTQARCLLQRAAFFQKDYKLTLEVGTKTFQEVSGYDIAFLNAMASACLKDVRASVGWLECAHKNGLPDLKKAVEKEEFNAVREDTHFQSFLNSH